MDKRIACYDIDGTLSKGMLFVPLIASEHTQGFLDDSTYDDLTDLLAQYKQGVIDYETAVERLIITHARGIEGQSEITLRDHASAFLHEQESTLLRAFGKQVIELLRATHTQIAVTAEPQYLAQAVVDFYELDGYVSTQYEVKDALFAGTVTQSLAHRSAKLSKLESMDVEYAFGDSEGDIEMLRMATHAFCVEPTPGLEEVAKTADWAIYRDDMELVDAVRGTLH